MTSNPDTIHHFDAATAKRGMLYHGLPMVAYPWRAWESRELVWNFFKRELLGRFRGSLGGMFWVLVQPLFQFAVYFLIFGVWRITGMMLGETPLPRFQENDAICTNMIPQSHGLTARRPRSTRRSGWIVR